MIVLINDAVELSAVRLAGMGARRMRRTITSDFAVGYMQQRLLRHHVVCQREKGDSV